MSGLDVVVLRDPRESVRKCSLTPLRSLVGVRFLTYAPERLFEVGERVLLDVEGEEIGPADRGLPLLLIDCAWRRVEALRSTLRGTMHRRRLPRLTSAYPRKSRLFADPGEGLASVEALYAAVALLQGPRPELLAAYRWREEFLRANPGLPA